ncbi:MAG: hypothetical protein C7B45_05675 [Sulfobacillus acidophilus]|uniref:Tyr recombinase domain-containing protein n=1 Tax=Sulfobacillus acidophilus TaxID=53633 RepID=A0A2T2WKA9_9FIRM|nr:MAG: hypothetical protein C7B45_05675 [Sulfobacillus acidophilus]
MRVRDVRLTSPAVMTLHGKGQKTRQVPILGQTTALLTSYLTHHQKTAWGIAGTNAEMKWKALESTYQELQTEALPQWKGDDDLMHWLQDLCK